MRFLEYANSKQRQKYRVEDLKCKEEGYFFNEHRESTGGKKRVLDIIAMVELSV